MAPRANWKGYLRLSLVSCPIALYPATSEREKISFNQINSKTGNRIKMNRVDAARLVPCAGGGLGPATALEDVRCRLRRVSSR